jgi:hypothetical protein
MGLASSHADGKCPFGRNSKVVRDPTWVMLLRSQLSWRRRDIEYFRCSKAQEGELTAPVESCLLLF